MTSVALATFIKTDDGNYQNFSPGEVITHKGDNYSYLGFLYQGAVKNRTGDNLEAGLVLSNNKLSMGIALKNVKRRQLIRVASCLMNRENSNVQKELTNEIWVASSMTYNPEQVEVILSSAIDAVGTNAPLRVLMSKDVGKLPTSAQINNG